MRPLGQDICFQPAAAPDLPREHFSLVEGSWRALPGAGIFKGRFQRVSRLAGAHWACCPPEMTLLGPKWPACSSAGWLWVPTPCWHLPRAAGAAGIVAVSSTAGEYPCPRQMTAQLLSACPGRPSLILGGCTSCPELSGHTSCIPSSHTETLSPSVSEAASQASLQGLNESNQVSKSCMHSILEGHHGVFKEDDVVLVFRGLDVSLGKHNGHK